MIRSRRVTTVLFDLYDTLAFIPAAIYAETKRRMAGLLDAPAETFARHWRDSAARSNSGELPTIAARIVWILDRLALSRPTSAVVECARLEAQMHLTGMTLVDEARDVLGILRGRAYRLGIVSNGPRVTRPAVRRLGLLDLVDVFVLSSEIGASKPDPRPYAEACRRLGARAADVIFVGDGNNRELDGAHAMGMMAVAFGPLPQVSTASDQSTVFDARIGRLSGVFELLP